MKKIILFACLISALFLLGCKPGGKGIEQIQPLEQTAPLDSGATPEQLGTDTPIPPVRMCCCDSDNPGQDSYVVINSDDCKPPDQIYPSFVPTNTANPTEYCRTVCSNMILSATQRIRRQMPASTWQR